MRVSARTFSLLIGLFVVVGAPLATAGRAQAMDGFRCESGKLVETGDRTYDVRTRCGEPDQVNQRTERRKVSHTRTRWVNGVAEQFTEEQEIEVQIDEWTFDLGPHKFIRTLRFENDRLVRVTTSKRGTGSP